MNSSTVKKLNDTLTSLNDQADGLCKSHCLSVLSELFPKKTASSVSPPPEPVIHYEKSKSSNKKRNLPYLAPVAEESSDSDSPSSQPSASKSPSVSTVSTLTTKKKKNNKPTMKTREVILE